MIETDGDDRIFDGTLENGFEEAFAGAAGIGKGVHDHVAPNPSSHERLTFLDTIPDTAALPFKL
ncbi:hypothetical protein [Rhizobium leguminosarum]|uniref:hypothetical protein n=1 Tax=Rhizobium leguminosarum TaxID=384 RepID=UPI001FDA849B|nr:hypothetical protein [Rhizobium leguminosarum]